MDSSTNPDYTQPSFKEVVVQMRHHHPKPRVTSDSIHRDPNVHFPKSGTATDNLSTHNSDEIPLVDVVISLIFPYLNNYLIGKIC